MAQPQYIYHALPRPHAPSSSSLSPSNTAPIPHQSDSASTLLETPQEKDAVLTSVSSVLVSPPLVEISPQNPIGSPPHIAKGEVLWLLFKRSITLVGLGVVMMVAGIGIIQGVLLPRIHTCPQDATCPYSFDPNSSNILPLLQSFMSYWLQAGLIIASLGLVKLSACQSWFIMMWHGNTIDTLDLNMGAIKGSALDAGRLILRSGNRWLGAFVLSQVAINAIVSLIVGLSFSGDHGQRLVTFSYFDNSRLPDSSLPNLNNDGQLMAIAKVVGWAFSNDRSHGQALQGTLVVPDGRSEYSINAQPSGARITGDIQCSGVGVGATRNGTSTDQYDIRLHNRTYSVPSTQLSVTMTNVRTASTDYLWVSNLTDLLPNATRTDDGLMDVTFCTHSIYMVNQMEDSGIQYLRPNTPVVPGCKSTDLNVCAADSVNNAILSWWGGQGSVLWRVSCRGGVLGPLKSDGTICPLTTELWSRTVTSMLDGIMQTAPKSGRDVQDLWASVETRSIKRWWLQGIIPLSLLLLYGSMLCYTMELSQGNSAPRMLNLSEIIGAAQTDYVRTLVDSGQLKKYVVQEQGGGGFFHNSVIGGQ